MTRGLSDSETIAQELAFSLVTWAANHVPAALSRTNALSV